jgi:uncharacterized protein YndB with AHSA1/START domain
MKLHNATDRIEKEIVLRAPRSRVWQALADAEQFGAWFGVKFDGAFAPGARVHGQLTTPGHEHVTLEFAIERMDPESRMSYRWHPYAVQPGVDYSSEPTTLVEFQLEEVAGGTALRVVESGFDRIPAARRAEALRMNDAGWAEELENIARHVAS